MNLHAVRSVLRKNSLPFFLSLAICPGLLTLALLDRQAQSTTPNTSSTSGVRQEAAQRSAPPVEARSDSAVPTGTILPVILPAISSKKLKEGATIKARTAQEVRLAGGVKIRRGAIVLGHVVSSTSAAPGHGASLTIKFDTLVADGKTTPIRTNLRALASVREVEDAQLPMSGPGESDVYDWLSTQQIGGEVVYGKEGSVARGSRIVGQSTYSGVFVDLAANASGHCRGEVAGNKQRQATWVFSSDACGLYGFTHLEIRHAGRTAPFGEIVLGSNSGPVLIRSGSGALLRID